MSVCVPGIGAGPLPERTRLPAFCGRMVINMDIKTLEAAIEAILFASGEPVALDKIAQILEIDKPTAAKIIGSLSERKNTESSGLKIIRTESSYQMVTKPEFAPYVRKALEIRRNTPLSPAAMEALAIVAYNQPVTKGYIEQVRGVDCSSILNNLVAKNLVEERGRLEVPGRPILYGTTLEFLKCFGLGSIRDLPEVDKAAPEGPEA